MHARTRKGGSVDFSEMCQTINEYKQSKEQPQTPSADPTQTEGEMLVSTYTGFNSVVYQITIDTPINATVESQDADIILTLVGDVHSPELKLPRLSPTRTDFVIGQTARITHTNFLPGSREHFWFRSLDVGSITAVIFDIGKDDITPVRTIFAKYEDSLTPVTGLNGNKPAFL